MTFLEKIYWGNTVLTWFVALGLVLVTFLTLILIKKIMLRHLSRIAKRTATQIDDLLLDVLFQTKLFFLFIAAFYIGSKPLVLPLNILKILNSIFIVVVIIQIAFWCSRGINFLITLNVKKRMADDAASATTISVLGFISKLIMWSIVLLLMLDNLGVNITSLIAGLGVGGIAVALATQNILGDLFASLSIVIDKPFVIGDFIVVDELMGTVEHIGMKTTRLRSLGGEQLIFSNNDLLKSRIKNCKRMMERRVLFGVGVTYQTPLEKLPLICDIVKETILQQKDVRFERVHFKNYGDSALHFEVVYFVLNPDYNFYMDIQQAINLEIFRRFSEAGIEFAYPTRTVFIQNELSHNKNI